MCQDVNTLQFIVGQLLSNHKAQQTFQLLAEGGSFHQKQPVFSTWDYKLYFPVQHNWPMQR